MDTSLIPNPIHTMCFSISSKKTHSDTILRSGEYRSIVTRTRIG